VFIETGGKDRLFQLVKPVKKVQQGDDVYYIYYDGHVTFKNGTHVLPIGTHYEGLKDWLDGKNVDQGRVIHVGEDKYICYKNGEVKFENGTLFSSVGGCDWLIEHFTPKHNTTIVNNVTYHIYPNGTVTDINGTFVVDGGKDALIEYIRNTTAATHF